jgi:winged helix DNA-binding protein
MAPRPVPEGSALSLDRILHGPLRLGIVAALATADRRSFTELRDSLGATDGNLNASLQKLEQAGYVAGSKKVDGRVPVTEYQPKTSQVQPPDQAPPASWARPSVASLSRCARRFSRAVSRSSGPTSG